MLGLLGAMPVLPALAQNPNQPIYQGAQPQVVKGVEDEITNAKPKIRHVYLAAPDMLGMTVDAQHLWAGPVQKYVPQPGDEIKRFGPQPYGTRGKEFFWNRQIIRNGVNIGNLVGPKEDHYSPAFKLEGRSAQHGMGEVSSKLHAFFNR
jgi:hypothetical protein